jgi:hypothetical protein
MGPATVDHEKWHIEAKLQGFATSYLRLSPVHFNRRYPMPKYVIERPIPGIGASTRNELHAASAASCAALDQLGPDIQWVHSYVTADKIYCVYIAANKQLIRDHAERSGFPADSISEVRAMIDPTMSTATALAA